MWCGRHDACEVWLVGQNQCHTPPIWQKKFLLNEYLGIFMNIKSKFFFYLFKSGKWTFSDPPTSPRNFSSMALREILLFSIHITQTLPHVCQHRLSINSVDCSTHEKLHSRLNVNEKFLCISIETSIADVRQQQQCSCCNFFAVFQILSYQI